MDSLVQKIKERVLLSSVVAPVVKLRGRAPNFTGLCPFHNEKTPSFHVRDQVGRFKCFGCGASGDIFEFLMKLRGINFNEAKEELMQKTGLKSQKVVPQSKSASVSSSLLRAQEVAQEYFLNEIKKPSAYVAKDYLLKNRGLSEAMLKQAALGFGGSNHKEFVAHLKTRGVSEACAIDAGLLKKGLYGESIFVSRITFPVRNQEGRVIAFGGRSLPHDENGPKYINTHNYQHFEKRKNFYGLFESKTAILKGQAPVLVEGYLDAMAFWALGLPALASCGTAFGQDHAMLLKKMSHRVMFCFDADNAGILALRNALLVTLPLGIKSTVVELVEGKDPGDYLAQTRLLDLKERVLNASDALRTFIENKVSGGTLDIDKRIECIDELLPLLAQIKRPLVRRQYVLHVAQMLHEEPRLLWSEIENRLKTIKKSSVTYNEPEVDLSIAADEWLLLQVVRAEPRLLDRALKTSPHMSDIVLGILSQIALLVEHKNGSEAFLAVQDWMLKNYPRLWPTLKDVLKEPVFNSFEEAEQALDALENKIKRKEVKALVKQKRMEVHKSEQLKDYPRVMDALKQQSILLSRRKPVIQPKDQNEARPKGRENSKLIARPQDFAKKESKINDLSEEEFFNSGDDWL